MRSFLLTLVLTATMVDPLMAGPDLAGYWRFENEGNAFLASTPSGASLKAAGTDGSFPSPATVGTGTDSVPFPASIPLTGQGNTSAVRFDAGHFQVLRLREADFFETGPFTIEAFIRLDALPKTAFSVILSRGGGQDGSFAWQWIVTGAKSSHGPGQLLFQYSETGSTISGFETLKSGFEIRAGECYYVALTFDPNDRTEAGVRFYLKKIGATGEAMTVKSLAHRYAKIVASEAVITIGANGKPGKAGFDCWHGYIDEVRISKSALPETDLLIHTP